MNLLVLIIPILITNLFIILILKNNKSLDSKMLGTMLFKYSVIILFAIVEYIYLIKYAPNNMTKIIISIIINSICAYLMGNTIYNVSKANELNDIELLKLSRISFVNMIAVVGLVLTIML